jgi:two-component system phosphate regulon sensor histidine kinase PhoR
MKLLGNFKGAFGRFAAVGELERLTRTNEELREKERTVVTYVRRKINQLLLVMGTLPLRPEELDDQTLLDLDPIGIIADSFAQVLDHLNETNDKLKLANREIQAILTAAGVGILVVDSEMRIQAFNHKLRELFLRDGGEVIGKTCYELLCKREDSPAECTCEKVLASRMAARLTDWEYGDRHFDVAGAPIRNRYGDVTHVVIVYNDITDRKRTEGALRETGEMYRNLFEHASDLIQSVGPDGGFNFVNRAWRETLGYSGAEAANLGLSDIIHPDHRDECLENFRQLLTGAPVDRIDTVFLAKDGTPVPVEGNVSCIFDNGVPVTTSCIFRRVSGRP